MRHQHQRLGDRRRRKRWTRSKALFISSTIYNAYKNLELTGDSALVVLYIGIYFSQKKELLEFLHNSQI